MNEDKFPTIRPCIKCGRTPQVETARPEGRTKDIYRIKCECGDYPQQWSVSISAAIRLWNGYVAS
ncbi:MAG: serine acetyltransferase [Desulfovibrio sp.]|nr:serine acetyltransferase [Desulfovibrio sp.]